MRSLQVDLISTQKQFDDAIARGERILELADGVELQLREPVVVEFKGKAKLYAAAQHAEVRAMSAGGEAYATVKGALAYADANGAKAYATVKGALAYADANGAKAYATADGARAFAYEDGAKAYATADGATVFADAEGAEAYACATGARAEAAEGGRAFFDLGACIVEATREASGVV